ncbi:conserved hypothetical protein [Nitrosococcus halophilus Nc 4]|uniref:Uncharacterized protein n=1 Tax=Nitrosococcus halophilus (strain Nc4) TaxID=472759 RepID=D5BYN6_NITHN|nr:hypothetical protein [Nitrosococcus halophilus]ADE16024.1 conserved hypothetical protein [Nitrosococcus halophilus Nc 4]
MNAENPLSPRGEGLRKALRWLLEEGEITGKTIEQASRQYNLSPLEEDFLIRKFLQKRKPQD